MHMVYMVCGLSTQSLSGAVLDSSNNQQIKVPKSHKNDSIQKGRANVEFYTDEISV